MKLNKLLFFTLCLVIFSCNIEPIGTNDISEAVEETEGEGQETEEEEEEEEEEPNTDDNTLIKKIIFNKGTDDETIETYTYEGHKLIKKEIEDNYFLEGDYFVDYIYENDRLVRVNSTYEGELDAYTIITYNENDQVAYYILHLIDDNTFKHVYNYNTDNTIKLEVYIGDLDSQTTLSNSYTLSYEGSNLLSQVNDEYELSFQYDNKNGIYKNIEQIEVINLVSIDFGGLEGYTNNIIDRRDNDEDEDGNDVIIADTYEYIYNENGYPVTATYKDFYDEELEETYIIEYLYE